MSQINEEPNNIVQEDIIEPAESNEEDTVDLTPELFSELNNKIKELEEKAATNWERALLATSDLENYRKRSERELEKAHKFAIEKFVKNLIPVVDSLEQATTIEDKDTSHLKEGLDLTLKLFLDTLAKNQVTVLNPEGETFDPTQHEAMSMVPQEGVEPGTVLTVFQKGYQLEGRVIRPARVIVAGDAQ